MGQPVTVVASRSTADPGVLRFECNRPLTGMDHEVFRAGEPVEGHRPVDELARRIFALGGVDALSIHGNIVNVILARGVDGDRIAGVIENLFRYYGGPGEGGDGTGGPGEGGASPEQRAGA